MKTQPQLGILNYQHGQRYFTVERPTPSPDLSAWVEHYWLVRWQTTTPYTQATLPHPALHLTVEADGAWLYGVPLGKFTRRLTGEGRVIGIRWRAGGCYPWLQTPIARYTDQVRPLAEVWPHDPRPLLHALRRTDDTPQLVAAIEDWLRPHQPAPDPTVDLISHLVQTIQRERSLTSVEAVSEQCHHSKRHLQRLFQTYVGVSPKWVIQRYRLHEIIDQVAAGVVLDWAALAADLGYYDQSHLIRDFKAMVGLSPADYARQCAGAAS